MGTQIGSVGIRQLEQSSLQDGKIDKTEAKALGQAAKKEDPAVARQMLYEDAFENTDARATFAKFAGLSASDAPKNTIAGQTVGSATVTRTLGDPKGYENPLEAATSARMSGVANAAVVRQGDRYYPVELNKASSG